jgi:hypothetical protein
MNWKQSSVALLCGCAAVPAFAQDAPAAAPANAPAAAVATGGDIIVTAQRRN